MSVVAQALLCNFLGAGSHSLLFGDTDDAGQSKSRLLSISFYIGVHRRGRVVEGGLHL
jgi:hypothetical protein